MLLFWGGVLRCVGEVWVLGERAALVETGTILGSDVHGEQAERTSSSDSECDGNEHVFSIGACVASL